MNVEAIMTTSVKTCSPDDSLDTAARLMWENDCGCVPVTDANGQVVAMLTDRDVCMAAYTQGRTLGEIHVQAAMSQACHSVNPRDHIGAAERVMQQHQVRRLPVVSDGRLVGLVSLSDITGEARRESRMNLSEVTLDEIAVTLAAVCHPRPQRAESRTESSTETATETPTGTPAAAGTSAESGRRRSGALVTRSTVASGGER